MGIYGNDGTNSSVIFVKIYGERIWTKMGKYGCLGINNFGTTSRVSFIQLMKFTNVY